MSATPGRKPNAPRTTATSAMLQTRLSAHSFATCSTPTNASMRRREAIAKVHPIAPAADMPLNKDGVSFRPRTIRMMKPSGGNTSSSFYEEDAKTPPQKKLGTAHTEEEVLDACQELFAQHWAVLEPKFVDLLVRHGITALSACGITMEKRCIAHVKLESVFDIASLQFEPAMHRAVNKTLDDLNAFVSFLKKIDYVMSGVALVFWNGIVPRRRDNRDVCVRGRIYLIAYVEGTRPL